MNNRLTKITGKLLPIILLTAMIVAHFPVTASCYEIDINPAPYIINVGASMDTFVIHTTLPYGRVNPYEVTVNGVFIFGWKMDSLGYFDAIVLLEDIVDTLLVGEYNTLLLEGVTYGEDPFYGEEDLLVIDKGEGRGKIVK